MMFDNALNYKILTADGNYAFAIWEKEYVNVRKKDGKSVFENWRLISLNDGTYEIMSEDSNDCKRGLCITHDYNTSGPVKVKPRQFKFNENQRWEIEALEGSNVYTIKAHNAPHLLTLQGDPKSNNDISASEPKSKDEISDMQKWLIQSQ